MNVTANNARHGNLPFYRSIAIAALLLIAASFVSTIVFVVVYLYFLWRPFDCSETDKVLLVRRLDFLFLFGGVFPFVCFPALFYLAKDLYALPVFDQIIVHASLFFNLSVVDTESEGFKRAIWMSILLKLSMVPSAVGFVMNTGGLRHTYLENDRHTNSRLVGPNSLFKGNRKKYKCVIGVVLGFVLALPLSETLALFILPAMDGLDWSHIILLVPIVGYTAVLQTLFVLITHRFVFWEDWGYRLE